jgi:hypothetical protein
MRMIMGLLVSSVRNGTGADRMRMIMVGWTKQIRATARICVSTNMAHTKFYGFKVTTIKLNQYLIAYLWVNYYL